MKPFKILLFVAGVMLILIFIAAVFPKGGISIGDEFSLKFISVDEIFDKDTINYADISDIISNSSAYTPEEEDEELKTDSSSISLPKDTVRADPDSLKQITHLIEFPPGQENILHPLFYRLSNLYHTGELLRILHYGDSQIETDRITSFIRHKMQRRFGGSGCGLVPAVPLYNGKMSIYQWNSDNWKRYPGFGKKDSSVHHEKYGALLAFSSYSVNENNDDLQAWLRYEPSPIAYSSSKVYKKVSIYLGNVFDSTKIRVAVNDSIVDSVSLSKSVNYQDISWHFSSTPPDLKFGFSGRHACEVLGVSFDAESGVSVDNIPLRGSAGLDFSKNDTAFLADMLHDLNPGLFILQFGGNVIPYMKKDFYKYKKYFTRELKVIKSLAPGIPILVIGPSDMSVKEKGNFVTPPNLEKIRDAVKEASLESGCAFWDMYEAMGGQNSMPSWVYAEPSLAISDFVHFNSRGARLIAEMFYNALIYEYNTWLDN